MAKFLRIFLTVGLLAVMGFSVAAQPKVPAHINFAGDTVDLEAPDRSERMDRELIAFTYSHASSLLMLKRSERIFSIVCPILEAYGIPDDLKYLCVIESELDPRVSSGAGAAGLWQFMPAAAKEFGLVIEDTVDERYDIEKETIAACKYLKKSYEKFGDWMSVAASYNAGMGAITKMLDVQEEVSAMDLWMNTQTSRYIYRVLAAKMMFEDPSAFGFLFTVADCYPPVKAKEVVTVTDSINDLVFFAKSHGCTYLELREANIWLREDHLSNPHHRTYNIIIPQL